MKRRLGEMKWRFGKLKRRLMKIKQKEKDRLLHLPFSDSNLRGLFI
jgi:hypothetical protein